MRERGEEKLAREKETLKSVHLPRVEIVLESRRKDLPIRIDVWPWRGDTASPLSVWEWPLT